MPVRLLLVFTLASLFAAVLPAQPAGGPPSGASPWRALFDGKTTAGWRGFQTQAFPQKGWSVEDGCLHVKAGGGGGDIVTADQFTDFELRFEWKVAPGANSGVMYRVTEDDAPTWRTGPEYQVLDDAKHGDGVSPSTSAAALYALYPAEKKTLKPAGEFNEGRIVLYKGRLEHWLNGARVVSCEWGGDDFRGRIAKSKFKDMPNFATRAKGHIALQDHGDDVWYRNIRVREFRPENEIALFDGKTFDGWTHHLDGNAPREGTWSITSDGVLVCNGNPAGYVRTTGDWTNFVLRLEWRFDPVTKQEGNSGVLFRMIGPDKVWPKSIEAQLHSKQAGDFWLIDDFPMKVAPERTKGRNTRRLATNENPIGEWNEYEIDVDGGDVELRVNGMVLNSGSEAQVVPGKICLQSEGAPIHFRNIRILPIGPAGGH